MRYGETTRALDDRTDDRAFEKLATILLSRTGMNLRPIGGPGDRGRDAVAGLCRSDGSEELAVAVSSDSPTIVNISSVCASRGFPGRLSYNAAKAAIEAATRTLAVEWGVLGMRVNAVAPGFILTDKARAFYEDGLADAGVRASLTALGRFAKPLRGL